MNLYKLENGVGIFYCVAVSFDDAKGLLETSLDKADYGSFYERDVFKIELIAELVTDDFEDEKPNFSSGHNLLIQK